MKSTITWFLLLILISFIGCSKETAQSDKIFLENSADFSPSFLEEFFTNPEKSAGILTTKAASLQVTIENFNSKGRSRRTNDIPKMGNASDEYCRAARMHRERLAEITLLMAVPSRQKQVEIKDSTASKLKNLLHDLPAAFSLSESFVDDDIPSILQEMYEYDQSLRSLMHWKNFQEMGVIEENYFRSRYGIVSCEFQLVAASRLRQVFLVSDGWPKISSYGENADKHAFVVLHNLGHDLNLLEDALAKIETLYPIQETQKWHYPNLYDIIAYYKDEPQRFGWIIRCVNNKFQPDPPLQDPKRVNELRQQFGLGTLEQSVSDVNAYETDLSLG